MISTRRQALAMHLGFDITEMADYLYHAGRTSIPVYAIDSAYYCVTKGGNQKPAKHRYDYDWTWVEVPDSHLNAEGWKVWKSGN